MKCNKNIEGEIIIKQGVEVISPKAFQFCNNLYSVTIPDSVVEIKKYAFSWCTNLKKIKLPPTLRKIGDCAFENTGLTSLKIPDSVVKIGYAICRNCEKLRIVKNKRFLAYYNPKVEYELVSRPRKHVKLESLPIETFPSGFEEICSGACEKIKFADLEIPLGVKVIHKRAFVNCNIDFISFPDSLTTIKSEAFYDTDLIVTKIPLRLRNIGEFPFASFPTWLDEDYIANSYVIIHLPTYMVGMYRINDKVNTICEYAFGNSNIHTVIIPDSVKNIRDYAFQYCKELRNVRLSSNIKCIAEGVFDACSNLTEITIPEGVVIIGKNAFRSCTSLIKINLPSSIKEIGENAFDGCTALIEISIPTSCTKIGHSAFSNCYSLQKIKFNSILEYLGPYSFFGCSNLKSIELPNLLKSIEKGVFQDCLSLAHIGIPSSITTLGINCFKNCRSWVNRFPYYSLLKLYEEDD